MEEMMKKGLETLQRMEDLHIKNRKAGDEYAEALSDMAFLGGAEIFESIFGEEACRVNGKVMLAKDIENTTGEVEE